jgi:pyruvate-formate lyase
MNEARPNFALDTEPKKARPIDMHVVPYVAYKLLEAGENKSEQPLDLELDFTAVHKAHHDDPPAIREAHCLRVLYPRTFQPIARGDYFAGWLYYSIVGFGLENNSGGSVYYIYRDLIKDLCDQVAFSPEKCQAIKEMEEYWRYNATVDRNEEAEGLMFGMSPDCPHGRRVSKELMDATVSPLAMFGARQAGINLDFDKLLRKGIPGIIEEARHYLNHCGEDKKAFYQGIIMAMETMREVCTFYAAQAKEMAAAEKDAVSAKNLLEISRICENLADKAPDSFRGAIQLFWLYAWCACIVNYGRMDIFLGDFLAHDLDAGLITEDEAQLMVNNLFAMIARKNIVMNCRVIIGGRGRRNEKNANRFALMAMEASRVNRETEPQLTLRFYEGQDPALMDKALDIIGEGVPYPMLFNDDVNIPAVTRAFRAKEVDAEQYLPYGCGEYGLDHLSIGSPNGVYNCHKFLEAMIFDGFDTFGKTKLLEVKRKFSEYEDFETFYQDLIAYNDMTGRKLNERMRIEHDVEAEEAAFLFVSALTDDCLDRGLPLTGGGARYQGGIIESVGMVNTGDMLGVIKKFVFDEKKISPVQLQDMLRRNWEGYEEQYKMILDFPKYGNDNDEVDSIMRRYSDDVCNCCNRHAPDFGLDYYLLCNVMNRGHIGVGAVMPATPDGRKAWTPFANGNTPTAGNDKKGVTAFLKSIAKMDHSNNSGYTHNMKFSKAMFRNERDKAKSLLGTYFSLGGSSAMITCVGKEEMENALKEPEKYKNLMVRVGGFSARFVELESELQEDLIKRTLY